MATEITCRDAAEWEAWLERHHETEPEVWLVYWKKGTGKSSVTWAEAVEAALKFGWIDGQIRRIDDRRYKQRWTPRRPKSKWSQVNKEIALRHIETGEMRPRGLAAVEAAKASGEWDRAYRVHPASPTPADLKELLRARPAAKARQPQVSRSRWNAWLAWLEDSSGRARARRLGMIVNALETNEFAPVDAAAGFAGRKRTA